MSLNRQQTARDRWPVMMKAPQRQGAHVNGQHEMAQQCTLKAKDIPSSDLITA